MLSMFALSFWVIVALSLAIFAHYGGVAVLRLANQIVKSKTTKLGRNVLLVTAHPDDESMFFAPLILSLTNKYALFDRWIAG